MHAMAIFLFYSMKLDNYITQLSEIIIVWTIDKTIGLRSNEQNELTVWMQAITVKEDMIFHKCDISIFINLVIIINKKSSNVFSLNGYFNFNGYFISCSFFC